MRQVKLMAAGCVVALSAVMVAACAPAATPEAGPAPGAHPVWASVPPAPADPVLTGQACAAAAISAASSSQLFRDKMAAIETAAAQDDAAAMVAAADDIQLTFVELAHGLAALSKRPLSPAVRAALTKASAALTEISSNTYVGTTADISQRLAEVSATLVAACG
jgi:hypothetical protein